MRNKRVTDNLHGWNPDFSSLLGNPHPSEIWADSGASFASHEFIHVPWKWDLVPHVTCTDIMWESSGWKGHRCEPLSVQFPLWGIQEYQNTDENPFQFNHGHHFHCIALILYLMHGSSITVFPKASDTISLCTDICTVGSNSLIDSSNLFV